MKENLDWQQIDLLIEQLVDQQKIQLLSVGRRVIPTLTTEDILQPNDYLQLDTHPEFRYEEGTLNGLQSAQSALRASFSHL